MTVTVDDVTLSTGGEKQGTPAPLQPGEYVNVGYEIQVTGTYGENPQLICQLDQKTLFNAQVNAPGGGSFSFYAPTTPGSYYFICSLSGGGSTPEIYLTVE